ncbi:hypothetical protein [Gordonia sihwensis]|uniref:hypothetical protein n=1 Tax=Gordonia sihwensis TaxID=173559 RepID=UPI003D99743D
MTAVKNRIPSPPPITIPRFVAREDSYPSRSVTRLLAAALHEHYLRAVSQEHGINTRINAVLDARSIRRALIASRTPADEYRCMAAANAWASCAQEALDQPPIHGPPLSPQMQMLQQGRAMAERAVLLGRLRRLVGEADVTRRRIVREWLDSSESLSEESFEQTLTTLEEMDAHYRRIASNRISEERVRRRS